MINHWDDIRVNYPGDAQDELNLLMTTKEPDAGGKLILWHGPPGVGKTHCLRALAHAWKDWCDISYVIDPERYFGLAYYMLETMAPKFQDRWQLLIIEDAGEFLRVDGQDRTGQGMSRLLNLTDGLLGQGLKLLVLITTNEPLGQLHAAVRRPGRCLSTVQFARFSRSTAAEWFKATGREPGKMDGNEHTLAELYEQSGALTYIVHDEEPYRPGGYN